MANKPPLPSRPNFPTLTSTLTINQLMSPSSTAPPTPGPETASLLDSMEGDSGRRYSTISDPEHGGRRKISASKLRKRMKYYIPATDWIPKYSISHLSGDLLAGMTVASMLIPQSVSYASSLAHLSPVTGLFAASIPAIFYAILGTSRQLNVAPEAALSLLLGQAVDEIRHDFSDPHSDNGETIGLHVATIITVQVGFFTFLLGIFRLGFIDVVLSRSLLHGFVAAIAIVIMIEQMIPMLGLTALEHVLHPATTLEKLTFLIENVFTNANKVTTIISFGALAILVLMRMVKGRFQKLWYIYRIPEVFVVVVLSTILSTQFRFHEDGVDILGDVPINTGHLVQFPLRSSNIRFLTRTTSTAVIISVVGFLDSIVAAKQSGARFGYSISPNRELVALGAANIFGAFVPGTLPAYGSITRTRINGDVGGRTQMASLFCSALVLLATFFLLPLLYHLPKCVLASIICLVVFSLLRETPHELAFYWKMRAWTDLTLFSLTFFCSIIWNVEVGIVVSMILSLLLVVHRSSKTRMTILGRLPGTERWKPINENLGAEEDLPGVLIVRIKDNLDFANTSQLKERLRRLELYGPDKSHPSEDPRRQQAQVLVFHMADVDSCDASAAQIFYELLAEYQNRGVGLFMTHLRPGPRLKFAKAGIDDLLGPNAFRDDVADAVAQVEMTTR